MSKFITKDDVWGIRRAVRVLWDKQFDKPYWNFDNVYETPRFRDLCFNAFFNQQLPEAWRETLATVKRHVEDIEGVLKDPNFRPGLLWYVRNGQFNSANILRGSEQFVKSIEAGEVYLPTYLEIEEEKQRWQAHPQYNSDRGYSEPIREEMIQLRIHK